MVGEFELLAAIRAHLDGDGPAVPLGVDDDAAVLDLDGRVVLALDTLVDGVHVDRAISSLDDLGFKALSVNVSDLAAVGALPRAALVSLQRPEGFGVAEVTGLYDGLREAADRWGCRLVGGDTVSSPTLAVSVTVIGALADEEVVLRRDGALAGDLVVVIGSLGLAAAGPELHRATATGLLAGFPELSRAHRRPVALAEAVAPLTIAGTHAAIDVSDGLGRDLGHVAAASRVGIELDGDRLPIHPGVRAAAEHPEVAIEDLVLGGGDDYALAVAIAPQRLGHLDAALASVGLAARAIGEVVAGSGVRCDGRDVTGAGWEHR